MNNQYLDIPIFGDLSITGKENPWLPLCAGKLTYRVILGAYQYSGEFVYDANSEEYRKLVEGDWVIRENIKKMKADSVARYKLLAKEREQAKFDSLKNARRAQRTGPARLIHRMELLHQNMKVLGDPHKELALPTMHGFEVIELRDIICLCSSSNYTTFTLADGRELMISHPLREYEELLEEYNVFRIHQSYMINMDHVKKYVKTDGGMVIMSDSRSLEVSRRKREEFLRRISLIS